MSGWENDTGGGGESNDGGVAADTWKDASDTGNVGAPFNEGFTAGADAGGGFDDGFTNGAEAGDGFGNTNGAAADGGAFTCHRCGEPGHKARECPTAPEGTGNDGKCFNCGEEDHSKADCPNPRVFTGTCRICQKQGHPAAECPDKPPVKCYNCKEEGHPASECTAKRVIDKSEIADMDADAAWEALQKADKDRDLDDIRKAFYVYSKAAPEATYVELEQAFRLNNLNVHLIATEKELPPTHTYVSLQGDLDQKYQVGFHLSDKPKRQTQKASWPETPAENLERLKVAGMPMERGIPKCLRCNELGHTARGCPEEATGNPEKVEVKCVNCDEVGHRARDCPVARKDKFACRNCKKPGHSAAECTEPRSAEGVECRKCNEMGHFSKDCPQGGGNACRNCGEEGHISKECDKPRNPATVTCRNCDQLGHFSKDCKEPRDYSKVKCSNCNEMGHTKVRCKQPPAETNDDFGNGGNFDNDGGARGDFGAAPAGGGGGEFGTGAAADGGGGGGDGDWNARGDNVAW